MEPTQQESVDNFAKVIKDRNDSIMWASPPNDLQPNTQGKKEKKYFSEKEIQEMGVTLLKAYTDAGNTIVTSKDGMETLKKMDMLDQYKQQVEELQLKISGKQMEPPKKTKHRKYPTNYQPPKNKNRKK